MKNSLVYIALMAIIIFGCVESDIVGRFTPDQVERLLTGGDMKTWVQTELIVDGERKLVESCADTMLWVFEVIDTDSTASYGLTFDRECLFYDTTFFGAFSASSFDEVFTDSLKFEGGTKTFMRPRFIRSDIFSVSYGENGEEVITTLEPTKSEFLARQVGAILTDGVNSGSSRNWYLTSLTMDGVRQQISNCSDSLIFEFKRSNSLGEIMLNELEATDTTCTAYITTQLGAVTVGEDDERFFDYTLTVDGSEITEMTITSFDLSTFSAQYTRDEVTHVATYQKLD